MMVRTTTAPAARIARVADVARPGEVALSYWRALRWLAVSRIAMALLLFAIFPLYDTSGLVGGVSDPALYGATALSWLVLAVVFLSVQARMRRYFEAIVFTQTLTDIVAFALLMHAAGGLKSGLVVLLIVALAGSAIVSTRRMAAFFAAVATLAVLGVAAISVFDDRAVSADSLVLAGWAGIGCFAAAMTVNWLATRLHAQERIAQMRADDLQRQYAVTSRIVAELAQGVLIVDVDGVAQTTNAAGRTLFPEVSLPCSLAMPSSDAPPGWQALAAAWRRWCRMGAAPDEIGQLELPTVDGMATNVRVRFLGSTRSGEDTVIMLEDQRVVEDRAQQLKLASMGRFSASIAHEIRNPLSAIRHANGLIAERVQACAEAVPLPAAHAPPGTQAAVRAGGDALTRLLRIVESNIVRIDRIVEDVLSVARRERPTQERVDPGAFLGNLVDEFTTTAAAARNRVALQIDSVRPIRFDSGHLRQVLLNLLTNALRHATPAEAAVRLQWREREDGRAELRVADDGPGMDAGMLAHAFEPFYTTDPRGTGLGLYLARELCQANDATIRYELNPAARRWRSAFIIEPRNE